MHIQQIDLILITCLKYRFGVLVPIYIVTLFVAE